MNPFLNDQIARAHDAVDRATDEWDNAINQNGIGSLLNYPYQQAVQRAEDRLDRLYEQHSLSTLLH